MTISHPEKFSVLLPVYAGDQPEFFARAIKSVTVDQLLRPDELVIVRDGPVSADLDRIIDGAVKGVGVAGVPTTAVRLPENKGLSEALNAGLAVCRYDVIARADADDISVPQRFAKQLPFLSESGGGFGLVGSAIKEFETDENRTGITRVMPQGDAEIRHVARSRDPFNHPTVVFRRQRVEEVGGYIHLAKIEDYWLFARMLMTDVRTMNVPEALVLYRIGAGAYKRRGGLDMLRSEISLQRAFLKSGFVSPSVAARNIAVRGIYRLVPTAIRRPVYRAMMKLAGKQVR